MEIKIEGTPKELAKLIENITSVTITTDEKLSKEQLEQIDKNFANQY